jgi:hypothetical protein
MGTPTDWDWNDPASSESTQARLDAVTEVLNSRFFLLNISISQLPSPAVSNTSTSPLESGVRVLQTSTWVAASGDSVSAPSSPAPREDTKIESEEQGKDNFGSAVEPVPSEPDRAEGHREKPAQAEEADADTERIFEYVAADNSFFVLGSESDEEEVIKLPINGLYAYSDRQPRREYRGADAFFFVIGSDTPEPDSTEGDPVEAAQETHTGTQPIIKGDENPTLEVAVASHSSH